MITGKGVERLLKDEEAKRTLSAHGTTVSWKEYEGN